MTKATTKTEDHPLYQMISILMLIVKNRRNRLIREVRAVIKANRRLLSLKIIGRLLCMSLMSKNRNRDKEKEIERGKLGKVWRI